MMYQKACHFHDEEIANDILHTDNVAEIKKLGRKVHNYDENVWNGVRQIIVYKRSDLGNRFIHGRSKQV